MNEIAEQSINLERKVRIFAKTLSAKRIGTNRDQVRKNFQVELKEIDDKVSQILGL